MAVLALFIETIDGVSYFAIGIFNAALDRSFTYATFLTTLRRAGYEIKAGANVKHTAVKPPGGTRFIRLSSLGEGYSEDAIKQRLSHSRTGPSTPKQARPQRTLPKRYTARRGYHPRKRKTLRGFRALYVYYLYLLRAPMMRLRPKCKRFLALLLALVIALGTMPSALAAESDDSSTAESLPAVWQAISDALPDPIAGYDQNDPDNPYPYGLPVDTFDEADLVEADPYGIMLLASGQGSIPDEMWDNTILRALEYTGFNLQYLKDNGLLYKYEYTGSRLKTNAPSVLSDIGYWSSGTCPNGDETVTDTSTVSGKAPNIARFEQYGLVCASFVTYYLCNYLPNIEGVDTSHIYAKAKATGAESDGSYSLTAVALWKNTLDALASESGGGVTKYTSKSTAYDNLVPGDVIIFTRSGSLTHVAIYAGAYTQYKVDGTSLGTYHYIVHVGNSRGPEISTVEFMANAGAKSSEATYWYHLDINDAVDATGYIEINKKDTSGTALAGAYFTAVDQTTQDKYVIGPTNASGYAKSGELPLGTYVVTETVFPTGYESNGTSSWTVTLSKDTPNMTITINAVNKLITGSLKIQKATNTGLSLGGWSFGVYTDSACTNAVSGSPFSTGSDGSVTVTGLVPGTYYVKELSGSTSYWTCDNGVKTVKVTGNTTSTVTVTNTHYGYAKIVKQTNTGASLSGWKFNIYTDAACTQAVSGSPFTTGTDGTISAKLLPGTYYVVEVDESSKYPNWDYDTTVQKVTVVAGSTASVTFTNTHYGYAKIVKQTNTGASLSGWKFNIYTDAACTQAVSGSPFTTGSDGIITARLLPGTYYVVEVDESSKYPNWDYDTTVRKVTVVAGSTASVTFTNTHYGYAKIIKQTNTGASLSGWKFNIYTDAACTQAVSGSPFTTGSDGIITARLLPGTYYVAEVDESSKYPYWAYDSSVQKVTVTAGSTASVTFNNVHRGRVQIVKTMPDGGSAAGWEFEVYRVSDNTYIGTFTSGSDGTILTGYIEPGQYRITEKIPEDSIYYCESANPQTVTVVAGQTAKVTFTNRIKPGKISVQKVDTTGTPRAGAEFLLEWSSDGVTWAPVANSSSTYVVKGYCSTYGLSNGRLTTGADGLVTFEGLHPELQYRLTETKAPDGLQLLSGYAYEGGLSVDQDLTVSLTVVNVPVFTLPETGSRSLLWMTLSLGVCLAGCAGAVLRLRRKEN